MISHLFLIVCLLLSIPVHSIPSIKRHPVQEDHMDYYAIQIQPPQVTGHTLHSNGVHFRSNAEDAESILKAYYDQRAMDIEAMHPLLRIEGHIPIGQGHYLFAAPRSSEDALNALNEHPWVKWSIRQEPKRRIRKRLDDTTYKQVLKTLDVHDDGIRYQWHLNNMELQGADVNVTGVWLQGNHGEGVVVSMIDDGCFKEGLLQKNRNGSWDFNLHQPNPKPVLEDDIHGTRCAGEIAAVKNAMCGIGVAYKAQISGIRILGGPITDVDEAIALNHGMDINSIYSCSWGPPDDGQHVDGPNELVTNAMINGIKKGRNGKGSLFVFATGNGGYYDDNCNYDGYTNSIYTISIGAIDIKNQHPPYSEKCSAHLGVTYSSGNGYSIYTTDVRPSNCTNNHGGTSAAAPIAAGILALVLSVRPDLTWRDVQHVTLRGAAPFNTEASDDWQKTVAGRYYSHKYGYGRLDAYRMVEVAKNWTLVRPQVSLRSQVQVVNRTIAHGTDGLVSSVVIAKNMPADAEMDRLEHVTVVVTISHSSRGDLDLFLISPKGIISHIGPRRKFDDSDEGFKNWTFMTVKHWEEPIAGEWKLRVVDNVNPKETGILHHWWIKFWGESTQKFADGNNNTKPPADSSQTESQESVDGSIPVKPVPPSTSISVTGGILITCAVALIAFGLIYTYKRFYMDDRGFSMPSRSWWQPLMFWRRQESAGSHQILDDFELEAAFMDDELSASSRSRSPSPSGAGRRPIFGIE